MTAPASSKFIQDLEHESAFADGDLLIGLKARPQEDPNPKQLVLFDPIGGAYTSRAVAMESGSFNTSSEINAVQKGARTIAIGDTCQ